MRTLVLLVLKIVFEVLLLHSWALPAKNVGCVAVACRLRLGNRQAEKVIFAHTVQECDDLDTQGTSRPVGE